MPEGYIKGQPNISWWIDQVQMGVKFRQQYAREKEWNDWRMYYRNVWRRGVMPSALYFKMLRTIVPRIYFRNPSVSVTSSKPGLMNMAMASVLERVDNKLLRMMKVKKQLKKVVQNAFMFGTGVGKLGYGAEFSLIPDPGDTTDPIKGMERFEYNSNVHTNMPWFMSVHPGNLIVPTGLNDFEDSRWVAVWVKRPVADVQGDPRFKNTKDLKGTMTGVIESQDNQKSQPKRAVDMIDLVEIKDKKTGKVFVIAPHSGGNKPLYYANDELSNDGRVSIYTVTFNEDDEVFWGVPDSVVLDPLQREINEIKTQQMKHRRLTLIRILAKRNSITVDEAEKMVSELVSPVVWTEDDIDKAVRIIEGGHIPNDLFAAEENLMQDTRETVGFSRNQFGEYKPGSSDTTATEARIVQMASEIRVDERRDMIADLMIDMVTDMHQILFEQWDGDQVIDIVGPNGAKLWVAFSGEMLKNGAYETKIDPDSSIPETKAVREQKAVSLYGLFQQNPLVDGAKLTRWTMNEMNNIGLEDLMRGLPPDIGMGQERPMSLAQLGTMMQNAGQAQQQRGGPAPRAA